METKYSICDKVAFFNTTERRVQTAEVNGVQIVPTGISKNEKGENVLDGFVVLYQTFEGQILAEPECFSSEEACKAFYRDFFK